VKIAVEPLLTNLMPFQAKKSTPAAEAAFP
jgi:hypothetical protein